ncbi:MFS transporter [Chloroflexota bacterium]
MIGDRKPRIFYGYVIVLLGFCIQMVMWGTFNNFGVFFSPLLTEYGWARATVSGARSIASLVFSFTGILAGRLGDKIGPRITMTVCGLFLGLGYLLLSRTHAVWQLYLFYSFMVGVGMSGSNVLPLSAVARWFVRKRGMMSGIVKVGAGAGMLAVPILVSWLIATYSWHSMFVITGSLALVSIVLTAQFLARDPAKKGLLPYGADEQKVKGIDLQASGFSLREAIRLRQFWMLCGIFLTVNFCTETVLVHIVPYALDLDISAASAASILATIGGVSIAGRFIMGSAGDRLGNRLTSAICLAILAIGIFWLQFTRESWMLYLFAVMYGFTHGGFFALISPLVAELFGLISHGVILGIVIFAGTLGGAIGPVLAGYIFDITGSYSRAFLICGTMAVIGLILALLLKPTDSKGL